MNEAGASRLDYLQQYETNDNLPSCLQLVKKGLQELPLEVPYGSNHIYHAAVELVEEDPAVTRTNFVARMTRCFDVKKKVVDCLIRSTHNNTDRSTHNDARSRQIVPVSNHANIPAYPPAINGRTEPVYFSIFFLTQAANPTSVSVPPGGWAQEAMMGSGRPPFSLTRNENHYSGTVVHGDHYSGTVVHATGGTFNFGNNPQADAQAAEDRRIAQENLQNTERIAREQQEIFRRFLEEENRRQEEEKQNRENNSAVFEKLDGIQTGIGTLQGQLDRGVSQVRQDIENSAFKTAPLCTRSKSERAIPSLLQLLQSC